MEQRVIDLFEYLDSNLKYTKRNYLKRIKIINKDSEVKFNLFREFLKENDYKFEIINSHKIMIYF